MFCRYCGEKIADGMNFCSNCGKKLAEPVSTESIVHYEVQGNPAAEKGMRICINCGSQIESNISVCPKCGNKVVDCNMKAVDENNITINSNLAESYFRTQNIPTPHKSRKIALLLALLWGSIFGAHDFYLGYWKRGIIHIVLCFAWGIDEEHLLVLPVASILWTVIEIIAISRNRYPAADGSPLK